MDTSGNVIVVTQNPCGCHPFDLMIEYKKTNGKMYRVSLCGFYNQIDVEEFLSVKYFMELK